MELTTCNCSISVDGGPLTDNVVFASAQRVHVLKRAADLQGPVTASCGEKNYKNAKPIWQSQFYFAGKGAVVFT